MVPGNGGIVPAFYRVWIRWDESAPPPMVTAMMAGSIANRRNNRKLPKATLHCRGSDRTPSDVLDHVVGTGTTTILSMNTVTGNVSSAVPPSVR